jgi:succinoglycan biosynthesis protein ExoA
MISIAVLTTTYRRSKYLRRYLESIISTRGFPDLRLFILINGDDIETESLLEEYSLKYHNIRFIKGDRYTRGKARNILMAQGRESDIFYFLDDDCRVTADVFSVLSDIAQAYPSIDCFGGPNLTPPDADIFAQAQGYALGSFFGAFWVRDRYRTHGSPRLTDDRSLILCNLAVRRKAFERADLSFNEAVVCAEENFLIQFLISAGHRCMHVPHLAVFHERRNSVRSFWRQMFIYGRGRCQILKKGQPGNRLVLMFFGAALITLCLFFCRYFDVAVTVYVVLCVAYAVGITWRAQEWKLFWPVLYIFPLIHAGYILGFISGFLPAAAGRKC